MTRAWARRAGERTLFEPSVGLPRRDGGWSTGSAPVSRWRMTSDQAPVLWPFTTGSPTPAGGALVGLDLQSGAAFYADPAGWVLDPDIPVTNPNVFVLGKPGRGKSATVKALLMRLMPFGYRALVLGDPKDEYEPLCRTLGVQPFRIGPGLPGRINPLDLGPHTQGWADLSPADAKARSAVIFGRWLTLIRALVGSQTVAGRPVPFGPTEEAVTASALRTLTGHADGATRLTEVTLPQLWQYLHQAPDGLIEECRYASRRHFLDDTRLLRDTVGQLVTGTLAGLFDAPTTFAVDWTAPIQSLSLSALDGLGDHAVGTALLCLNSWGRGLRETARPGDLRVVVRDESWKQLRLGPDAVKAFDADLRLSRSTGDLQVAVAHKPSDLLTAGDTGSQAVAIAKDLLHLADIKVLHGQDPAVADDLDRLLGLGPVPRDLVTGWAMAGVGRAVWCVGDRHHQVQAVLHPAERGLADTNHTLRDGRDAR